MNPTVGWALAALALGVGWWSYGWRGIVLAVTVIAFWLALQLSRTLRVMRLAAGRPIGDVDSAVMLHAGLRPGMTLLEVIQRTASLGKRVADEPETFAWTDRGGATVRIEVVDGRCARWTLERPPEEPGAPQ
jgi:HAMP domain-containing protein